ncbi:hypothetical protein [Desulfomicrobium orale]|uniref:Uncharacterized protein n=1 Tax=Desulfomicrobium orale DSM 12838 TaxID=888061 RepID=A0A0X8JRU0_9BACT|nr:hypothetical protein [Desulfomicrobium orale]AMD93567.1 hypothetical protein AXF15_10945 [Desulfomicrobium orale DSM 12838]
MFGVGKNKSNRLTISLDDEAYAMLAKLSETGKPLGYDLDEFVDGMCQALSFFYDGAIFECIHASRL